MERESWISPHRKLTVMFWSIISDSLCALGRTSRPCRFCSAQEVGTMKLLCCFILKLNIANLNSSEFLEIKMLIQFETSPCENYAMDLPNLFYTAKKLPYLSIGIRFQNI